MKIIIKTKNIELTKALQDLIEEKIGGLKKFIITLEEEPVVGRSLIEAFVDVEKETEHHKKGKIFKAVAKITLKGKNLIAQARSESINSAVVKLKDELQQEIKKYKLKKADVRIRKQRKANEEENRIE